MSKLDLAQHTYLDHNATTPIHPLIKKALPEVLQFWGNPSSIHWAGREAKALIRQARLNIAQTLGVSPLEIVFTSGGSEANSTVIQSFIEKILKLAAADSRREIITSTVEHPSVIKALTHAQEFYQIKVHQIEVNRKGEFNWEQYLKCLSEKTLLVTMMYANNETGSILPIQRITQSAHACGALVHSDCVQAYSKIPVSMPNLGVDFISLSAHKLYALKGIGALVVKKGRTIRPLLFGGQQERGRRGGTENLLGIWSFGRMAQELPNLLAKAQEIRSLRDLMETRIQAQIKNVVINGLQNERLPNTSNMVIEGVEGETLLMSLDLKGFAVSTGAACSSGNPEPSPTLLAMGLERSEAQSSLRVSLGVLTTREQIEHFVENLIQTVQHLRSFHSDQFKKENHLES